MNSRQIYANARRFANVIVQLPEPPERFRTADLDFLSRKKVLVLSARNILVCEEDEHCNVWSVNPDSYEAARRYLDRRETLSCCNATGVRNVGGELQCADCGSSVSEEEFRRVFS